MLFYVAFSCVQVTHSHGDLRSDRRLAARAHTEGALLPNEANCPLCVAMHSTLPAAGAVLAVVQRFDLILLQTSEGRVPEFCAPFALRSKPPPSA